LTDARRSDNRYVSRIGEGFDGLRKRDDLPQLISFGARNTAQLVINMANQGEFAV